MLISTKYAFLTLPSICHTNAINGHKVYGVIPEIKDYIFPNGMDLGQWSKFINLQAPRIHAQMRIWTNPGQSMTTTTNRIYFTLVFTATW